MDIPERPGQKHRSDGENIPEPQYLKCQKSTGLLLVTLDPSVLVFPTVALLCALNVELFVTELVGRCCL